MSSVFMANNSLRVMVKHSHKTGQQETFVGAAIITHVYIL
jgi:hypothetical protein